MDIKNSDPAEVLNWLRSRRADEVKGGVSTWSHECERSDDYLIVDAGEVPGEPATIELTVGPLGQTIGLTRGEATEVVRMILAAIDTAGASSD